MKTDLKATLEATIQNWLEDTCEHDSRPNGYYHPELAVQMTNAAEAVFDAGFAAQAYAEQERGDAP